jgi:predicted MFS family arabinose efflux permease
MRVIDDVHVRDAAFALEALAMQLVFALGPLLAAGVVAAAGPSMALVAAGLITLIGTLFFASATTISVLGPVDVDATRPISGKRRQWTAALRSKELRIVLLSVFLAGCATGAFEVGLPAVAVNLGSGPASGVLLGLWASGAAAGAWFYSRRRWMSPVIVRLRVAALAIAVLSLPLIAARSMASAIALSLIAGLPWAALFASQYGRVGAAAPKHALTEAFTWNVAAIVGGSALGSAAAGVLISRLGAGVSFVLAAGAALAILVVAREPVQTGRAGC